LVDISLSIDGGASWSFIEQVDSPNTGVALEYWWTVPDTPSSDSRIKISAVGDGPEDISAPFTIFAPTSIPEPATLSLLALGIAGIGYQRRKQPTA